MEQYLRNERVVKEFTAYYDLFNKYKKEYQTEEILAGTCKEQTLERARVAAFDERLSLLGMLIDKIMSETREDMEISGYLIELSKNLKAVKAAVEKNAGTEKEGQLSVDQMLENLMQGRKKQMELSLMAGSLSEADKRKGRRIIRFLEEEKKQLFMAGITDGKEAFACLKKEFDLAAAELKERTSGTKRRLENLFAFVQNAFAEGNEMLILVTELTVNNDSARFIGQFGCEAYQRHSNDLMLSERKNSLQEEIEALELE